MSPDVGHFECQVRRYLALQADSPMRHEGSGDSRIHDHDGARASACRRIRAGQVAGAEISKYRSHVPLRRRRRREVPHLNGSWTRGATKRRSRWNAWQSEAVVEGKKRFPVHRFVHDSCAAAQHGPAVTPDVPGKSRTGSKVRMVSLIGRADLFTYLNEAEGGTKIAEKIICVLDDSVQLISETEV